MINLGYPWWLLVVVLVVFASLLYQALRGRLSRWPLAGLAILLAPLCTLAAVAVAVTLSATLSPLYEIPAEPSVPPARTGPAEPTELTTPAATPDTTGPRTPAPTASPSASPSASPTASPSASPSS